MSDVKMHLSRPAAWIEITGEDSFSFLQGQFTNDLRRTAATPVTYGLWLNRKGKVLADSFLLQAGPEHFFLYSPFSPAATIMERLEPFIIADDVDLHDLTGEAAGATIWGDATPEAINARGFSSPDPATFLQQDDCFLFHGRRSNTPSFELVGTGPAIEKTIASLSAAVKEAGGNPVDGATLERERIEAGVPAVPRDIGPTDLPQEGHLEDDAISYTKGCYLGQEVMARIHAMGQVRRTLVQVEIKGGDPQPPAPLYSGTREVGNLRSMIGPVPHLGLALVRRDILAQEPELSLAPGEEPTVRINKAYPQS